MIMILKTRANRGFESKKKDENENKNFILLNNYELTGLKAREVQVHANGTRSAKLHREQIHLDAVNHFSKHC
jgi:hypothetical protein